MLYMTQSNKVSGSRTLRKGSKKSSKKGSKKHNKGTLDFASLLNDMDDMQMAPGAHPQMEGMMPGMPGMSGMQGMSGMPSMSGMQGMSGMPNEGMMPMMPQMGMDQMAMAQMAMPQMGMPQMMMGVDPKNVDPLHLHSFVPKNENININNFGVNPNQLMSGSQMGQQFAGRSAQSAPAQTNNKYYRY